MAQERPVLIASLMREAGDTGVQTHVVSLARFLLAEGRAVEVLTPYGRDTLWLYPWFAFRWLFERLHKGLSIGWYRQTRWLALRWRLGWRLRDGRPALIYAQCPVSASAALAARRGPLQSVVMVVHFNLSQADEFVGQGMLREGGLSWRRMRAFEARVLPRLDGLVFVSRFMRDALLQRVPAAAEVAHAVLPNFIARPQVAAAGSESRPRRRLISVGTLEPRKNQGYLLKLFAEASRHLPDLELTLVGDGPDRAGLEALAREMGVAEQVRFLGQVPEAARLLPEHDAYVHTARLENLPIAIIEAMSCGLPVFACPVGGIPELFDDGREGRYLPLDSSAEAGELLARTLADAPLCERLASAARGRFDADFEQGRVARCLLAFLDARGTASGRGESGPRGRWLQRLVYRTSAPAQLLHSATSFLLMAGMARFAPSADFAMAAAFFLWLTLASSLNIFVLNAAWLRVPASSGGSHSLLPFTQLSSVFVGAVLAGVWAVYRHSAFGTGSGLEFLLAALGGLAYLHYLARRRQWLLEADFGLATLGDGLRAVAIFGGALLIHAEGRGFKFVGFLGLFVVAHLLAAMPWRSRSSTQAKLAGSWLARGLSPLDALTRGDWLGIGSGVSNLVFSQAASLVAPLLIGAVAYATLRAYELFLFPTIFMAQVLDPIYMRRYRDQSQGPLAERGKVADLIAPTAWLFLPLAGVCFLAEVLPLFRAALESFIAPIYRGEFWLLGMVLALSACVSLNAPLRWRLTVLGQGGPLLKGTMVGITLSLLVLVVLTHGSPQAWTVLVARMVYEASLVVAGLMTVRTRWRGVSS